MANPKPKSQELWLEQSNFPLVVPQSSPLGLSQAKAVQGSMESLADPFALKRDSWQSPGYLLSPK